MWYESKIANYSMFESKTCFVNVLCSGLTCALEHAATMILIYDYEHIIGCDTRQLGYDKPQLC